MRSYQEPVDVRLTETGEAPAMFVWRGRLYVVHRVAARREATAAWPSALATRTAGSAALALPEPALQTVWQVEASPGRDLPVAIFELAQAPTSPATWSLLGATDQPRPTSRRTP